MKELARELKLATQDLGNALKNVSALRAYTDAIAKIEADTQAKALLDE